MKEYKLCDSMEEMKKFENKSVDLLFTSPPDMSQTPFEEKKDVESFVKFQNVFLKEFSRLVKDDGFIVISQTDRMANGFIVTNHVNYINNLTDLGLKVKDEKVVFRNEFGKKDMYHFTYQYLTVFTRTGTFKRHGEYLKDGLIDKQLKCPPKSSQYCWSYDFCKLIIETFTEENDFVMDPFAATGMVPFVAGKLNRRYWAAEIDEKMYNENFNYFKNLNFDYDPFDDFLYGVKK